MSVNMDRISFIALWDTYRGLLTPTQREITDMYFELDLTVSEIAEQKGVSRQAISDCLKKCKSQLEEYESKLRIRENFTKYSLEVSLAMTDAGKWAENFKAAHPEYSQDIAGLTEILERDYSDEAEEAMQNPALWKDYIEEVYGRKKTGDE